MTYRNVLLVLMLVLSMGVLQGCSPEPESTQQITQIDTVPAEELQIPPQMTTAERMGLNRDPHAGHNHPPGEHPEEPSEPLFVWNTPEGWEEITPTSMRLANFKVGESTECYLTYLQGDGGGLAANLNRWRAQMGLEPYTDEEIAALPKRPFIGTEGVMSIMDGSFGGMSGGAGKPGYRMTGMTLVAPMGALFVKMVGPRAEVEANHDAFVAFCATLMPNVPEDPHAGHDHAPGEGHDHDHDHDYAHDHAHGEDHDHDHDHDHAHGEDHDHNHDHGEADGQVASPAELPAGHPPIDSMVAPGAKAVESALNWNVPDGWTVGEARMMREVTMTVGQSECYVSRLSGAAGGVEANINRWLGQMGQSPMDAAAFGTLETVPMLGKSVPYIEIKGDYTGMGGQKQTGYAMLGVVAPHEGETFFVKMIGPEAEVMGQTEQFKAFCASLEL